MMFQHRQTFLLGYLHAGSMFIRCESRALTEQKQLTTTAE